MNARPQALRPAADFVLRVLDGPSRGASAGLTPGRPVEIGHAWSSDIVLRDPSAKGARLRLELDGEVASVTLAEGAMELLGRSLTAPATALLPSYVPLLVGGIAICCGRADSPRWSEAERLLAVMRDRAAPVPEGEEASAAAVPGRMQALRERLPRVLAPGAILALATLAVAALAGGAGLALPVGAAEQTDAVAAKQTLAAAGFRGLDVEPAPSGRVLVRGFLPSDAASARLLALVRENRLPVVLAVQTNEGLVRQVEDLFRSARVKAEASAAGPGLLVFTAPAADPGAVETLRRRALAEIPGLRGLAYDGPKLDPQARSVSPGDPGKTITAVRDGADGFVATADGSRYFVGAELPTGHKIVSIANRAVVVERGDERLILSSSKPNGELQ